MVKIGVNSEFKKTGAKFQQRFFKSEQNQKVKNKNWSKIGVKIGVKKTNIEANLTKI